MSEEQLRKIAKEEASKFIMENLNSGIIFSYIQNLEKEIEELKEINKEHQKLNGKLREEIENLQNDNIEKDLMIDGLREERRLAAEEIQEQYFISKDKIRDKIDEIKILKNEDLRLDRATIDLTLVRFEELLKEE